MEVLTRLRYYQRAILKIGTSTLSKLRLGPTSDFGDPVACAVAVLLLLLLAAAAGTAIMAASSRIGSALNTFEENIRRNSLYGNGESKMHLTQLVGATEQSKGRFNRREKWSRSSSLSTLNASEQERKIIDKRKVKQSLHSSLSSFSSSTEKGSVPAFPRKRRLSFAKSPSEVISNNITEARKQAQFRDCSKLENDSPAAGSSRNNVLSTLRPGDVFPHTRFYSPSIPKKPSVECFHGDDDDPPSAPATPLVKCQKHDDDGGNPISKACSSPCTACSDAATNSTASVTSSSTLSLQSRVAVALQPKEQPLYQDPYSSMHEKASMAAKAKHAKLIRHLEARSAISPRKTRRDLVKMPSQSSLLMTPTTTTLDSSLDLTPTNIRDLGAKTELLDLNVDPDKRPVRNPRGRRLSSPGTPTARKVPYRIISPFDLTLKRAQIQARSMQLRRGLDSLIADVNSFSLKSQRRKAWRSLVGSMSSSRSDGVDQQVEGIEERISDNIEHPNRCSPSPVRQIKGSFGRSGQSLSGIPEAPFSSPVCQFRPGPMFQAFIRGVLPGRETKAMTRAAIVIQTMVRRVLEEQRFQVVQLKIKLAHINQQRRKNLVLNQLKSIKRKEAYRYRLLEKAKHKQRQVVDLLESRNKLIEYLEEENRKIQDQNLKLEVAMHRLQQINTQTETSTTVYNDNFQTLWKALEVLSKQEDRLQLKEDRYHKRIDKQMANMAATRARSMRETKIRKTLEKGLLEIVEHFENRCEDKTLVERIVAIGDGELEDEVSDGQTSACALDEEEEEGFLLTWCIDDEASINSDITSVHGGVLDHTSFGDDEDDDDAEYEEIEALSDDEDDDGDCEDDYTCQSSVWVETHSILF